MLIFSIFVNITSNLYVKVLMMGLFCCHFVCHEVIKEWMVKKCYLTLLTFWKRLLARQIINVVFYYYLMVAGCMYFSNRLWTSLVYMFNCVLRGDGYYFYFLNIWDGGLELAEFINIFHINVIELILRQRDLIVPESV